MRSNPLLTIVTGNPPRGRSARRRRLAERWREFHQAEPDQARRLELPDIDGVPDQVMALGVLRWLGLDRARPTKAQERALERSAPEPWPLLVTDAGARSLWIVSPYMIGIGRDWDGSPVHGLVYEPPRSSGKPPGPYWHEFSRPLPTLELLGSGPVHAAEISGGRYSIEDWIYD